MFLFCFGVVVVVVFIIIIIFISIFFLEHGVCCNEVLLNEWNFPFPSRITRFFVIVITVIMNPMRASDNICAILAIKP